METEVGAQVHKSQIVNQCVTAGIGKSLSLEDNKTLLQQVHQTVTQAIHNSGDCFVDMEAHLDVASRRRNSVSFIHFVFPPAVFDSHS